MNIQLARNGEVFGECPLDELRGAVEAQTVLLEDYAWFEGQDDWMHVSELLAAQTHHDSKPEKVIKVTKPRKKKEKPVIKDGKRQYILKQSPKILRHYVSDDWHNDPITEKQINYIAEFGIVVPNRYTKGQAGAILDEQIAKHPDIAKAHEERKRIRLADEIREGLRSHIARSKTEHLEDLPRWRTRTFSRLLLLIILAALAYYLFKHLHWS